MKKIVLFFIAAFLLTFSYSCKKDSQSQNTVEPPQPNNQNADELNETVFIIGSIGKLMALDAVSGDVRWTFILDSNANINYTTIFSSPVCVNNVVYIGSSDYKIYAIDAKTGVKKWSFQTKRFNVEPFGAYNSSPVVYNKTLYIGGANLYAINTEDGSLKWSQELGREINASPLFVNDTIYANAVGGPIQSFNATTGNHIASTNDRYVNFTNVSPRYHKGILYTMADLVDEGHYEGIMLYCAESKSLDNIGFYVGIGVPVDEGDQVAYNSPAVHDESLYVCADSVIYAYDITKRFNFEKWNYKTGDVFTTSSPIADASTVYAANDAGAVHALNAATGQLKWLFDVKKYGGERIVNSPTLANNRLYISSNRTFYSLNASTGEEIWHRDITGIYYYTSSPCVISKSGETFHSSINGYE